MSGLRIFGQLRVFEKHICPFKKVRFWIYYGLLGRIALYNKTLLDTSVTQLVLLYAPFWFGSDPTFTWCPFIAHFTNYDTKPPPLTHTHLIPPCLYFCIVSDFILFTSLSQILSDPETFQGNGSTCVDFYDPFYAKPSSSSWHIYEVLYIYCLLTIINSSLTTTIKWIVV